MMNEHGSDYTRCYSGTDSDNGEVLGRTNYDLYRIASIESACDRNIVSAGLAAHVSTKL